MEYEDIKTQASTLLCSPTCIEYVPSDEAVSPSYPVQSTPVKASPSGSESGRRGRPRADAITNLIREGSHSKSNIKCPICSRVFPREKSLQAHLRTHTGERPYLCDYPGCTKAFTQSGQLKTHQRLHAGEKPFCCTAQDCNIRFTHANRHCPDHPYASLRRCKDVVLQPVISSGEDGAEVLQWLEKYKREREERTPSKSSQKRRCYSGTENQSHSEPTKKRLKRVLEDKMAHGLGNLQSTPKEDSWLPLMTDNHLNDISNISFTRLPNESPITSEDSGLADSLAQTPQSKTKDWRDAVPKKRWLREAFMEVTEGASPAEATLTPPNNIERPSVLYMSDAKGNQVPLDEGFASRPRSLEPGYNVPECNQDRWLSAVALVQLALTSYEGPLNLSASP